jgi:hypothetical protein
MHHRNRIQFMFQNTGVRTQRNRVEPLQGAPNPMNWLNISTVVDEEGVTNWVRAVGFFSPTTLLISHSADIFFADDGTLTVISSVTADFSNIKSSAVVDTSSPSAITPFLISPGDYVAFAAVCASPAGPFIVTVKNKATAATIDTFQVQVEV